MKEFLYYIFGFRKTGAINYEDPRDFVLAVGSLMDLLSDTQIMEFQKGLSQNDNVYFQDQGNTNECVPTAVAMAMSSLATRTFGIQITFSAKYVRDLMIARGWYDPKKGAIVANGLKAVVQECRENGFVTDINGDKYNFPKYLYVKKEDWLETFKKGYQIVTGAYTTRPMIDSLGFFRAVKSGGGHCLRGIDGIIGLCLGGNSWKNFGIKNNGKPTGNFMIKENDLGSFFRGFIFPSVTKV